MTKYTNTMNKGVMALTWKQKIGILFLSVVLFAVSSAAQDIYLAPRAKRVVVDGKLNEWEGVPAITLNSNAYIVIANRSWKGPADLSGKIYVMWDEEYLYVACEIEDDVVIQEKEGTYLFQGDCIELYVRLDYEKNALLNYYTLTDFQFGFTPGTNAGAPDYHIWNNSTVLEDILFEAAKTSTGYIMEVAIPVWELGIFLDAGMEIGFDVAIDDVDSPGAQDTEQQLCWSMSDMGWQDPTVFQLVILD